MIEEQNLFIQKKRRSINNIILGRQVEVIITESVSYGHKTCQKHKVHGCISATSKGEWLWDKYGIERNIRYYSQSECAVSTGK